MIYFILFCFLVVSVGHFIYGIKSYLSCLGNKDTIVTNQSKAIFHYISAAYLIILTGLFLDIFGYSILNQTNTKALGLWFLACGGINFFYGLKVGIFKLFQWIFFFVISVLFFLY